MENQASEGTCGSVLEKKGRKLVGGRGGGQRKLKKGVSNKYRFRTWATVHSLSVVKGQPTELAMSQELDRKCQVLLEL